MPKASRAARALGASTALALAAGCGLIGGDEEPAGDEDRLVEMLNESRRLESELTEAENRIIRSCLEEQGHTVHDEWELMTWAPEEQETISWGYPHEVFLPDPEEAAEFGFGVWAESPQAQESGDAEDYWKAQEEEWAEDGFEEPDNSEFESLSRQERWDWYVAYVGEDKAEEWYGYVLDEEAFEEGGSGEEIGEDEIAELDAEADEGGELELEGESYEEPEPGGCQLEMIEGLYGKAEPVEHTDEWGDGESETWTEWRYRPENPEHGSDGEFWEEIEFEYADRMIDLQYEFTDCLAERGHPGWEFQDGGHLPTWEYFMELYMDDVGDEERWWASDADMDLPPLPDDAPSGYEDKRAYELEVAGDFVECGEETGYTEQSTEAYDEIHIDHYLQLEEDVYAWQDEMREAIDQAQDMLDA